MKVTIASNLILDVNKVKLVEFLSVPKAHRTMSLKRFAIDILGVSEPTVHSWKKDPEVQRSIRKTIENNFSIDIPDILLSLRDAAIAGDVAAAKLFLNYVDPEIKGRR